MSATPEIAARYAPHIYFDLNEPFFPVGIGYTVLKESGRSPSFSREIEFYGEGTAFVVEYAVYWDYDIEHLYDLEHVWVHVDGAGEVTECEGSFHGDYLRCLRRDRSNIEDGTHAAVYSQPGKHAFLPSAETLDLLPRLHLTAPCWELAGSGGVLVPGFLAGQVPEGERQHELVRRYMPRFRFRPAMSFQRFEPPEELLMPWEALLRMIPGRMNRELALMESQIKL